MVTARLVMSNLVEVSEILMVAKSPYQEQAISKRTVYLQISVASSLKSTTITHITIIGAFTELA